MIVKEEDQSPQHILHSLASDQTHTSAFPVTKLNTGPAV
jgi:hypothetical protein